MESPSVRVAPALPQLLAMYLRGSPAARNDLCMAHPFVFTVETVAALDGAAAQLVGAQSDASEAVRMIEGLSAELDLPLEGPLQPLRPEERRILGDPAAIVDLFAASLADIIGRGLAEEEERAAQACAAVSPLQPNNDAAVGDAAAALPWHQTPAVALLVLSFLPVQEVLMAAENVCSAWRYLLAEPNLSRAFWSGAIQNEFFAELNQLILAQGSDILNSDWRTLAMLLCVIDEEDENEEVA